jgi:anti-anti-sigma factor
MLRVKENKNSYFITIDKTTRLNALTGDILKDQLLKIVSRSRKKVILSLEGITFMDNSGFDHILTVARYAREHDCSFRLCDVSQEIYELISLMKVNMVFELKPEKVPAVS